ncbi:uncharacterized protein ACBR49_018443 [Aulostomus maculatus]
MRRRPQAEASTLAATQEITGITNHYNLRATTTGLKQPKSGLQRPQVSSIPSGIQRAAPGLRPPSARTNAAASSSTNKLCGSTASNIAGKNSQKKKHPLARGESLPVAKKKKTDAPFSLCRAEASTSTCDASNPRRPASSQRAKTQRGDAAVLTSTAETSTGCNAASRKSLKLPGTSQRAVQAKASGCSNCVMHEDQLKMQSEEILRLKQGCTDCAELKDKLKMQSEEIQRLKDELLKYKQDEEL